MQGTIFSLFTNYLDTYNEDFILYAPFLDLHCTMFQTTEKDNHMSISELDVVDRGILIALQGDLQDDREPYATIARGLEISEEDVLERIERMKAAGVIRRLGAMIRHIEAGIGFNGMVVWKVEQGKEEQVGRALASFPEVSHCYERPPFGDLGGTIFTMVHSASEEDCLNVVRRMAQETGIGSYEVLFSKRELKKISMTYFDDGGE